MLTHILELADGLKVFGDINVGFFLEMFFTVHDQLIVKVLTTEKWISIDTLHVECTIIINLHDGDIESTTAKIKHQDVLALHGFDLFYTERNGSGCWFGNHLQYF